MWKKNFTDYATGIAFNLQLSKRMCDFLQYLVHTKPSVEKIESGFKPYPFYTSRAAVGLERRGLIERDENAFIKFRVTEAGRYACNLLDLIFDIKKELQTTSQYTEPNGSQITE